MNFSRRILLAAGFSCCVTGVDAQPFDPVIELFRLGQDDHLIIDRGGPVDSAGDVNGDGIDDLIVGSGAGGIRVVFGPTRGFFGTLNAQQLDGNSGFAITHDDENISVVAGVGDVNADGFADVLVGSTSGAHVFFGQGDGFARTISPQDLDGRNGFSISTPATSVSGGGDVNKDGISDIIIGNGNASPNSQAGSGITYVIYGRSGSFPSLLSPAALDGSNGFAIMGINAQDRSGTQVGDAGDFNNDGYDDVLIGAPNKSRDGKAEVGEAYLVLGGRDIPAVISLADIDGLNGFIFKGNNIQDSAGAAVGRIGDLNHDGIEDIAIGAPGKGPFGSPSNYPGETYILFGGNFHGERVLLREFLNGSNGFRARGIRGGVVPIEENQAIWGDLSGTTLDAAGDINNDGIDDLMIGASHTIRSPARKGVGQAYFIYGSASGYPQQLNLDDLDGASGFRINGIGTVDYFAVYARQAGDFNDDGFDDVIIGASGQGASYVFYGRDSWLRNSPAPGVAVNTAFISSGFPASLNVPAPDAPALAFNELADPTGPNPLPPGTPVVPGGEDTPGNIPAYTGEPVPPPRHSPDQPSTQTPTEPVVPPVQDTQNPPTTETPVPPVTQDDIAGTPVRVGTGSMGGWLSLVLLVLLRRLLGCIKIKRQVFG